MSGAEQPLAFVHDPEHHRFVLQRDGYEAVLMYAQNGKVLDFYHTYVPESLRERGIAEKMVRAGFDYAQKNGFMVLPSCGYVREYFLPRNRQYLSLVAGNP